MWKVQIPAKHNLAAFRARKESVCIVFQGQCLLLVINNVNNSCSAFFHSFSHQWYTLSHLCHIPPFGPLPHPTSNGNQKPPGLARRVPPQHPTEDIIYGSRYDADSSINKGLSLLLFQPSQSFQCYLSPFPACAGRIVGAAEKHTCWNIDKILQSVFADWDEGQPHYRILSLLVFFRRDSSVKWWCNLFVSLRKLLCSKWSNLMVIFIKRLLSSCLLFAQWQHLG